MNWVDQCKDVFLYKLGLDLHKKNGKQLAYLLKKMSKESGIPYGVLGLWYQESKYGSKAALYCQKCGNYPIRIRSVTGKPSGPGSTYFGLCWSCSKILRGAGTHNHKKEKNNVKKR